jgi:hypothetical protein
MQLGIEFSFMGGEYQSGLVEFLNDDERTGFTVPIRLDSNQDNVQVGVPADSLRAGTYTVTLYGVTSGSAKTMLAQDSIRIELH